MVEAGVWVLDFLYSLLGNVIHSTKYEYGGKITKGEKEISCGTSGEMRYSCNILVANP
jgi:hypothetical protein